MRNRVRDVRKRTKRARSMKIVAARRKAVVQLLNDIVNSIAEIDEDKLCQLCLNAVNRENCIVSENEMRNLLNNLFLLDLNDKIITCKSCSEKIIDLFNFKARCLHVEDEINDVINSKNTFGVDLREVCLKVKDDVLALSENEHICRFCLGVDIGSYQKLQGEEEEINCIKDLIKKYIPEMDLQNTNNPIACEHCYNILKIYLNFINNNCLSINEQSWSCQVMNPVLTRDDKVEIKEECFESDEFVNGDETKKENFTEINYEFGNVKMEGDVETYEGDTALPSTSSCIKIEDDVKSNPESDRYFHHSYDTISAKSHP